MADAFVYILTNKNNTVLYTGSTESLKKRIYFHKKRLISGFSKKYNVDKLVHFEAFTDKSAAFKRELQIKKKSRKNKILLVEKSNPQWLDLYSQLE